MLEAHRREHDRQIRQEAAWVAALMNATGNFKDPITADSLLSGKSGASVDIERLKLRAEARRQQRLLERAKRGDR